MRWRQNAVLALYAASVALIVWQLLIAPDKEAERVRYECGVNVRLQEIVESHGTQ